MASTWASGAVIVSTRRLKEKVLDIVAAQLEISADDLEITDGVVTPRGAPAKAVPLAQVAMQAAMMPDTLPPGVDARLEAQERFKGDGITGSGWSGGTHVCTVEVDIETGRVHDPSLRRGRGLRPGDQPGDRRRPGAWRRRAGHRRGALRARRVRRRRQLPRQHVHGLPPARRPPRSRRSRSTTSRPTRTASSASAAWARAAPSPPRDPRQRHRRRTGAARRAGARPVPATGEGARARRRHTRGGGRWEPPRRSRGRGGRRRRVASDGSTRSSSRGVVPRSSSTTSAHP